MVHQVNNEILSLDFSDSSRRELLTCQQQVVPHITSILVMHLLMSHGNAVKIDLRDDFNKVLLNSGEFTLSEYTTPLDIQDWFYSFLESVSSFSQDVSLDVWVTDCSLHALKKARIFLNKTKLSLFLDGLKLDIKDNVTALVNEQYIAIFDWLKNILMRL
ncbi:hypothetical protein [Enterovibrio norvegicus]|uniref:hypothetical protein n=1 Tax=Enterovibrio norvegicus TaxID=188144 RepID=UPI0024B272ED|nr:hypothetical protein [Enterovibrio norvegicus]